MIATHTIQNIQFANKDIILTIDGIELQIPLEKLSAKLSMASEIERTIYKISPAGYGIHWPLIDEDLSIEGIVKAFGK